MGIKDTAMIITDTLGYFKIEHRCTEIGKASKVIANILMHLKTVKFQKNDPNAEI